MFEIERIYTVKETFVAFHESIDPSTGDKGFYYSSVPKNLSLVLKRIDDTDRLVFERHAGTLVFVEMDKALERLEK